MPSPFFHFMPYIDYGIGEGMEIESLAYDNQHYCRQNKNYAYREALGEGFAENGDTYDDSRNRF